MWILQILTLILIIKIMATMQEFREVIQRNEEALQNVIEDIQLIKQKVEESGLTGSEEQELMTLLQGVTVNLENLANENPEVPSPENPNLEEEI